MVALIILAGVFLAFANGANDNFKGVATLYGSGTASFRTALAWATITTLAGSLVALIITQGLIAKFGGKGLVPDEVLQLKIFPLSVVLAAALTVMLATRLGFPISTTHALTGALVGAGFFATTQGIHWNQLGSGFVIPLLLTPIVSLPVTIVIYLLVRKLHKPVDESASMPKEGKVIHFFHFLSAGVVSFARGLNDTPKIAAMLLIVGQLSSSVAILIVAFIMALGGLLKSRKIAETMSQNVTPLNSNQGFAANMVTSGILMAASFMGLPASTTHVSCGALFGIGTVTKEANWSKVTSILLAWVITLPVAAVLSAGLFVGLQKAGL